MFPQMNALEETVVPPKPTDKKDGPKPKTYSTTVEKSGDVQGAVDQLQKVLGDDLKNKAAKAAAVAAVSDINKVTKDVVGDNAASLQKTKEEKTKEE